MSDFSVQDKVTAVAPKVSALLSILGSSFIIWDVIRKKVRRSTQHRILLGMSNCDLIASLTFFLTTWPIPALSGVYGAVGNQSTCTAQGFFSQFALTVAMYNASLSLFYVAQIRWQWNPRRISRKLEPWLHAIPILVGLGTSVAGIFLNLYNNDNWACYIASHPQGCSESWKNNGETNCIRGDNASLYRWILSYAFIGMAIVVVTVNMLFVYFAVLTREKAMDKYLFGESSMVEPASNPMDKSHVMGAEPDCTTGSTNVDDALGRGETIECFSTHVHIQDTSDIGTARPVLRNSPFVLSSRSNHSKGSRSLRRYRKQSKRVAVQGYWYCGAFYATWTLPIITRFVQLFCSGGAPNTLLSVSGFLVPMQGFFNCLVYVRPQWLKWRRARRMRLPKHHKQKQGNNLTK